MKELKVSAGIGVENIEVRTGEALKLREPEKVQISGVLNAPLEWLKQRKDEFNHKQAYIKVNADKGTIVLQIDEKNFYGTVISGSLEISPIFKSFGINSGEYKTPLEMSEFIKMNRAFFENRTAAMALVTELRNFKAKVNKDVEQEANLNKGDRRLLMAQVVESNIPETFNVCLPIFKGMPKQTFEVETYFNPDDFTCTLVSPQANEVEEDIKEHELKEVLSVIETECPDIVIIYQ